MIKAKITGCPLEITQATKDLAKCFNVVKVSNQNKDRNSSYVRVYVDLKLKENESHE